MHKDLGLTLIELMLAMALGTLLLLSLGHFVTQTRQLTAMLETLDNRLDHQRLSWLLVQRDIQMAGFSSCVPAQDWENTPLEQYPVLGWEALGTAPGEHWQGGTDTLLSSHGFALPQQMLGRLAPGSDVLLINRAQRIPLSQWQSLRHQGEQLNLRFAQSIDMRHGEQVVLADLSCEATVTLTQQSRQGHTLSVRRQDIPPALLVLLEQQAVGELQLLSWQTQAYYVGFTEADWALFRRRLDRSSAPAEELIRGVLTQQVLYGEPDASGTGLMFHPADRVQQWQQVRALHWGLLLAETTAAESPDNGVLGVQGWVDASSAQWPLERSFSLRHSP